MGTEIKIVNLVFPEWPRLEAVGSVITAGHYVIWAYEIDLRAENFLKLEKQDSGVRLVFEGTEDFIGTLKIFCYDSSVLLERKINVYRESGIVTLEETSGGSKNEGIVKITKLNRIKNDDSIPKLCDPDEEIIRMMEEYYRLKEEVQETRTLLAEFRTQILAVIDFFREEHWLISSLPFIKALLEHLEEKVRP